MTQEILGRTSFIKDALDEIVKREALTTDMEANPKYIKQIDAKTFKLMSFDATGLKQYTPSGGFSSGEITNTWQTVTLSKDRGIKLNVDADEELDTGGLLNIATVASEYVRTKVIPEIDAYRMQKAFDVANVTGSDMNDETVISKSNAYSTVVNALDKIADEWGDTAGITIYANMNIKKFLDQSSELSICKSVDGSGVDLRVPTINGAKVVYMPSARMWSEFDYTTGFVPEDDAKALNFVVVAPGAEQGIVAINNPKIVPKEYNIDADADVFTMHILHDAFVPTNKMGGVYVSNAQKASS